MAPHRGAPRGLTTGVFQVPPRDRLRQGANYPAGALLRACQPPQAVEQFRRRSARGRGARVHRRARLRSAEHRPASRSGAGQQSTPGRSGLPAPGGRAPDHWRTTELSRRWAARVLPGAGGDTEPRPRATFTCRRQRRASEKPPPARDVPPADATRPRAGARGRVPSPPPSGGPRSAADGQAAPRQANTKTLMLSGPAVWVPHAAGWQRFRVQHLEGSCDGIVFWPDGQRLFTGHKRYVLPWETYIIARDAAAACHLGCDEIPPGRSPCDRGTGPSQALSGAAGATGNRGGKVFAGGKGVDKTGRGKRP